MRRKNRLLTQARSFRLESGPNYVCTYVFADTNLVLKMKYLCICPECDEKTDQMQMTHLAHSVRIFSFSLHNLNGIFTVYTVYVSLIKNS